MNGRNRVSQYHVAALLLLLVTVAAYLQVFRADFVNYDDEAYVTANPHVQSGLTYKGTLWAFNVGYQGNWHPLTWLSHMLDCRLFGPSPIGPHAVNLLLHLANTLLLLLVLNLMTRSLWKSAFVAALFALHPLHVESVTWVAERKDVLSTLFWLLTMWAYVQYTESPSLKRYGVVTAFFALGLMSKPTLVTLPFVLLLLDYWPLGRWAQASRRERWRLVRQKLPLFAMSVASSVVTYVAQQRGGAVSPIDELSLASRIANALTAYIGYVGKMLWPAKLSVFYPHPGNTPIAHVLAAVLLLAAVTALAIRSARSRPYLIMGWFWYLIVLAPMIGFVQVGRQAMADRYTYVPFIGLFIMIAWGMEERMGEWGRGRVGDPGPRVHPFTHSPILRLLALLVILACAACTWRQAGYWHDSIKLWTHTLAVTTNNSNAHNNLGLAFNKLDSPDAAMEEFQAAVLIDPQYSEAHDNLGVAYFQLGRIPEAIDSFTQAIRIAPDYAEAHNNLGLSYVALGMYAEAIDEYKLAIRFDPGYVGAHGNLAMALYTDKRYAEAWAQVRVCEQHGVSLPQGFLEALASKMPEPE